MRTPGRLRRAKRASVAAACWAVVAMTAVPALAGEQVEEALSASVRHALSRAVSDRAAPRLVGFASDAHAQRWLEEMSRRLATKIPDAGERRDLLTTVQYEAARAGLDPQLVLGVIQHESGFKKYAVSIAGARGYMQVMPFWAKLIGTAEHNLFHLRTNLRYGCIILRHYLDMEGGDLFRALGRYNGSLGRPEYPTAVVAHWQRTWRWQGGDNPASLQPVALTPGTPSR